MGVGVEEQQVLDRPMAQQEVQQAMRTLRGVISLLCCPARASEEVPEVSEVTEEVATAAVVTEEVATVVASVVVTEEVETVVVTAVVVWSLC